jgi:histone H3/H4
MNPGGVFKENREIPQAARGFSPHDPEVSGATRAWKRAIFKGEAFFRQARLRANSARDWLLKQQGNSLKKPKTSEKLVFPHAFGISFIRALRRSRRHFRVHKHSTTFIMSGRGKGGKGLGKGGAKRHRKVLRDNIQGITKPAIRRLARRGGVKRISGLIYEETRGVLKVFLENVIRDAVTYTEHARRKTVTAMDVVYALKRQGRTLYGFGG